MLPRDYTIFSDELLADLLRIFNNDALDASDDGVFFTPKSLVKMIVNVFEPSSGTLLDCACGGIKKEK